MRDGIHLSIAGDSHFNSLIWTEEERQPHQPAGPTIALCRELTTTPTPTTKTNTPTKFPTDAPGAGAGLAPSLLALVTLLFVF
jgi:hypothetical protein